MSTLAVVIPSGSATSNAISVNVPQMTISSVIFPAVVQGTTLNIEHSIDNGVTWVGIEDMSEVAFDIPIKASKQIVIEPILAWGLRGKIRLISNVNQDQNTVIRIIGRPL